jgi:hypothetical protein
MSNIYKSRTTRATRALGRLSPFSQRAKNVSPIVRGAIDLAGMAINTSGRATANFAQYLNKQTNNVVRRAINTLEDIGGISSDTARKARVAIEIQAQKDGGQVWRKPNDKKTYSQKIGAKAFAPTDVRGGNLQRLAEERISGQTSQTPIEENVTRRVSSFGSAIGQRAKTIEEQASRKNTKGSRIVSGAIRGARAVVSDYKAHTRRGRRIRATDTEAQKKLIAEQIKDELTNPEINTFIKHYPTIRNTALLTATAGFSQVPTNVYNWASEKARQGAQSAKTKASELSSKAFRAVKSKASQVQRELIASMHKPNNAHAMFMPQKIQIANNTIPAMIALPSLQYKQPKPKKSGQERASQNYQVRKGMTMRKMHTPMKSVSVPYTRTLTDDSVPTPMKYMKKMMGGKTGRMGKELTGADGVKGRYFQKGRDMYKIYEVDKPHAPQMRAMGMGSGMGKMQKRANPRKARNLIGQMFKVPFMSLRGSTVPVIQSAKMSGENAVTQAKNIMRSVRSGKMGLKNIFGFSPSFSAPVRNSTIQRTLVREVAEPNSPIISEAVTVSQKGRKAPKVQRYVDINVANRNVKGAEDYLRRKGVSLTGDTGEISIPRSLQIRRGIFGKRSTHKMHEITNENYYGNQKPRRKDTFQKNQGAFINGRKLKY